MKTYQFGLPDSDRIVTIVAASFREALKQFREQMRIEGLA